jgi:hypothetical protein
VVVSPLVKVHAPLGPDLSDYLSRIARYNRRPQAPTDWRLNVHAGPDFLDRMRDEAPGGIAIFSGRNRGKIERIIAALETGLHVLADKPAIVEPTDLPPHRMSKATIGGRLHAPEKIVRTGVGRSRSPRHREWPRRGNANPNQLNVQFDRGALPLPCR